MGSTPPAAMLAFLRRSRATKRSFADASGSSRIRRSWARPVGDVAEGGAREQGEDVGVHLHEGAVCRLDRADALGGEQPVRRVVRAQREELGEGEVGHRTSTVGWGHGP
jgi:hypothetical protein